MGKRKDAVEKWHVSHLSFMTQNISDDAQHRRCERCFEELIQKNCWLLGHVLHFKIKLKICSSEGDTKPLRTEVSTAEVTMRVGETFAWPSEKHLCHRCQCQSWDEVTSCDARSSWKLMGFLKRSQNNITDCCCGHSLYCFEIVGPKCTV